MKLYLILFLIVVNVNSSLSENLDLLILHNNDMHGRFEETSARSGKCQPEDKKLQNCVGGIARVAHVIRQARKAAQEGKGPQVLYLNGGDTYTGTPWFSVHKWKIVVEFLNLLEPNAV
ncbi:hypothetical protein ILUMI_05069, partial [Ignelater luminosus]